jgi:hypothetical protein
MLLVHNGGLPITSFGVPIALPNISFGKDVKNPMVTLIVCIVIKGSLLPPLIIITITKEEREAPK